MTLDEAIVTLFRSYAPLAALVGTRIYPDTYPQGSPFPVLVYTQTSRLPEYSHDGACGAAESRYQLSAIAKSKSLARQTAETMHDALKPWETEQAQVAPDLRIGGVFMEDEMSIYAAADVEQESTYHILGDYRFLWGT